MNHLRKLSSALLLIPIFPPPCQVLCNVAQGLHFLHTSRPPLPHGALSSANVLVDRHFVARLADAGLPPPPLLPVDGCDQAAAAVMPWTAPECRGGEGAAAKASTPMADAYAFGILIYECLARTPPQLPAPSAAPGDDCRGTTPAIARSPSALPRPAAVLLPPAGCSAEAAALMWDCLCAEPTHRPAFVEIDRRVHTLAALGAISSSATDESGGTAGGGGPQLRRRRRLEVGRRGSELAAMGLIPPAAVQALARGEKVPPEPKEMITMSSPSAHVFADCHHPHESRSLALFSSRILPVVLAIRSHLTL
jgi:hypothetical protein